MKLEIAARVIPRTATGRKGVLAAVLLCVLARVCIAHSDPSGDVYPNVKVEGGNFVVEFHNNASREEQDDTEQSSDSGPVLRMIFSADGELLAPRHVHGRKRDLAATMGEAAKERAQVGDETITIERGLSVQPLYSLQRKGRTEVHRFPWPSDFGPGFEALCAGSDYIGLAAIKNSRSLLLAHFDRRHFALPQMMQLSTELSFIWDFPVVSNLVRIGNRYCIAWPRYNRAANRIECVISTWSPGEDRPKEIVLHEPADTNTHLSLATIGDRLCVAYHCLAGEGPMRSKIIVVFRKISAD